MTWLLRPGVGLARRDADHLQLGIDPPRAAVLPDTRAVRLLLVELAHGSPLTTLDAVDRARAGRAGRRGPGRGRRRRGAPDSTAAPAAGCTSTRPTASSRRRCGWSARPGSGSPADRGRRRRGAGLDARASRPATGSTTGCARARRTWWSGRRRTARCSAPTSCRAPPPACAASTPTLGEADPRRALVVEQVATDATAAAVGARPGPARAGRWPGRSATSSRPREGGVPATWSATVALGDAAAGPSRRTAGTCTAAAPGPSRSSARRWRPGEPAGHQYSLSSLPSIGAQVLARAAVAVGPGPPVLDRGAPGERLRLVGLLPPAEVAGLHRRPNSSCRRRLSRGAGYDHWWSYPAPGCAPAIRVSPQRPLTGGIPSRSYRARARARRACCAACSALRLSRRARASWWPRRNCCASPRRADICARARFSFMRFISVLLVM